MRGPRSPADPAASPGPSSASAATAGLHRRPLLLRCAKGRGAGRAPRHTGESAPSPVKSFPWLRRLLLLLLRRRRPPSPPPPGARPGAEGKRRRPRSGRTLRAGRPRRRRRWLHSRRRDALPASPPRAKGILGRLLRRPTISMCGASGGRKVWPHSSPGIQHLLPSISWLPPEEQDFILDAVKIGVPIFQLKLFLDSNQYL
ncbi:uncharacterized protein LOC113973912 [Neopelma chrysocephalum]|uniref:uncharacterized protein LOC113973912 n=1 Tax=Neopelma chrysocephalum TaxID=114329 RepID=UPI000FCD3A1C|nr:uncharacterized protein LOC113973912 [Neopelma chrysocephalum]